MHGDGVARIEHVGMLALMPSPGCRAPSRGPPPSTLLASHSHLLPGSSGVSLQRPAVAHSKCWHELTSSAFCCHLPTSLRHTCPKHFLCQPQDPFQSSPKAIPPGCTHPPHPVVSVVVTIIAHLHRKDKSSSLSFSDTSGGPDVP